MESDQEPSIDTNELSDSNPPFHPFYAPPPPPPPPPSPSLLPGPSSRSFYFPNADVLGELTADQFNVLIFQYLREQGFQQTASEFENEAMIQNIPIDKSIINEGALPAFVHKGLRFTQLEANMHATDADSSFECYGLDPLDIIRNNVHGLSNIIKYSKGKGICDDCAEEQKSNHLERNINVRGGPQVSDRDMYLLEGHSSKVSAFAWSPTDSLLAVGFLHSSSMILEISDDFSRICSSNPSVNYLFHPNAETYGLYGSCTTLAWNGGGELLAMGLSGGLAIVWRKTGGLKKTLDNHKDKVFIVAWSSNGDFLLTVSCDNRIVVWDAKTWESKQEFGFHPEQLLGVAWRNDTSFAICSRGRRIYVYNIGESQPIKTFFGYEEEIHSIYWNPSGSLLASHSDGRAIKIWTVEQDESLHDLMHSESVLSIRWSPTGPGSNNPSKPYCLLASCSCDTTVKIWDCVYGRLLFLFNGHNVPVVEIEFHPDGNYLASASEDNRLLIWHVKDGTIVKSCTYCDSVVHNLSWDKDGKLIAADSVNGSLALLDVSFLCAME